MNQDKFRELLRGKIDSLEKWKEVCEQVGLHWDRGVRDHWGLPNSPFNFHWNDHRYVGNLAGVPAEQSWWVHREQARQQLLHLPRTGVMDLVIDNLRLHLHFIHVSHDDPTMVAYTASMEDGLRDKQVRLSFGRLLRKMIFLATDTHIQALEASHRSEMDPTFLVASTQEEIQRVYTTMAGDSGCMRHAPDNWDLPKNLHPSAAYCYAGLGVAYTEVDGRVMSRSVIYDNPDDPKDKRYVRIYGDPCLKRKLELAGYKLRDLGGVKLKAIDLHAVRPRKWAENTFLVPYIDGPGGSQGHPASHGYRLKGEDCIRVITNEQGARLQRMGFHVGHLKRTEAVHTISEVDPEKLMQTCAVTGETFNGLEVEALLVYHEGAVKLARADKVTGYSDYALNHLVGARVEKVHVTRADWSKGFEDRWRIGGQWLDTPENRRYVGLVQLAEAQYGANQWAHRGDNLVESAPESGVFYRTEDCTLVFDADGVCTAKPPSELDEFKKSKDYIQVAPNGSQKALSHKANPNLVMTLGKRRCIHGWHNVVQLYDGTWEYRQNTVEFQLFGMRFRASDKKPIGSLVDARLPEDALARMAEPAIEDAKYESNNRARRVYLEGWLTGRLRAGINTVHFFKKGEMLFRGERYADQGTLQQMRDALAKLDATSDEQLAEMLDSTYVPSARAWQHHANLLLKIADAQLAEWEAPAATATEPERAAVDDLLVETAVHIRDERFASVA